MFAARRKLPAFQSRSSLQAHHRWPRTQSAFIGGIAVCASGCWSCDGGSSGRRRFFEPRILVRCDYLRSSQKHLSSQGESPCPKNDRVKSLSKRSLPPESERVFGCRGRFSQPPSPGSARQAQRYPVWVPVRNEETGAFARRGVGASSPAELAVCSFPEAAGREIRISSTGSLRYSQLARTQCWPLPRIFPAAKSAAIIFRRRIPTSFSKVAATIANWFPSRRKCPRVLEIAIQTARRTSKALRSWPFPATSRLKKARYRRPSASVKRVEPLALGRRTAKLPRWPRC